MFSTSVETAMMRVCVGVLLHRGNGGRCSGPEHSSGYFPRRYFAYPSPGPARVGRARPKFERTKGRQNSMIAMCSCRRVCVSGPCDRQSFYHLSVREEGGFRLLRGPHGPLQRPEMAVEEYASRCQIL